VSTGQNTTNISPFISMTQGTSSPDKTPTGSTMQVDDKKSKHVEIIEAKKRLEEVVKKQKNSDFNIQELNIYQ
jgi:hypothetical protein